MNKKPYRRWRFWDIAAFSLSMLLTVVLLGGVMLGSFGEIFAKNEHSRVNDYAKTEAMPCLSYLFTVPQYNLTYELNIDFHKGTTAVKRLYVSTQSYNTGGLSGFEGSAEKELGTEYNGCLAVTETQLAAVIDYVGGVGCNVDKRISAICGGITTGWSNLAGISAIRIFEAERENAPLCLELAEELLQKWCGSLSNKRCFFRLLDLSNHNLSYADYLPISENFKIYKK